MVSTNLNAILTASFLTIAAVSPAHALDLNLGVIDLGLAGGDSAGVSASVGVGDQSIEVSAGGPNDTLVGLEVSGGGESLGIAIATHDDALLHIDASAATVGGLASIVLPDVGSGQPANPVQGGDSPGGGSDYLLRHDGQWPGLPGRAAVAQLFAQFDPVEQQRLVGRCLMILASPPSYERDLVDLCLALAQLHAPLMP